MGLSLEVQNKTKFKISKKIFLEILNQLKRYYRPRHGGAVKSHSKAGNENIKISGSISLILSGESEMRRLNKNYRHKDRATDVLSFPTFDGEKIPGGIKGELGDIFICPSVIKKNFGREYNKRLRHLFLHGTLHLLGFDHQDEKKAKRMEEVENKILNLKS